MTHALPAVLLLLRLQAGVLFSADFEGDPDETWVFIGEPLPMVSESCGFPAPSFDGSDETGGSSGAVSRASFDWSDGLVLEVDMYVSASPRGARVAGTIGLCDRESARTPAGMPLVLGLTYCYRGEADWMQPHLQGKLTMLLRIDRTEPDGDGLELRELIHFDRYLDDWHRYAIRLYPDGTAEYLVDDSLVYGSELSIPAGTPRLGVYIGSRSGPRGRVLHDSVVVRELTAEERERSR